MRAYLGTVLPGALAAGLVVLVVSGHVPRWAEVLMVMAVAGAVTAAATLATHPVKAALESPPPAMAPGEEDREPAVVILGPLLPSERDRYFEASPGVNVLWDPPGPGKPVPAASQSRTQ